MGHDAASGDIDRVLRSKIKVIQQDLYLAGREAVGVLVELSALIKVCRCTVERSDHLYAVSANVGGNEKSQNSRKPLTAARHQTPFMMRLYRHTICVFSLAHGCAERKCSGYL